MSYQGHLNDSGGQPVTDTLDITFRIYDVETGGTHLWQEVVADVPIIGSSFNAELGETNSIDLSFDTQYWMGMQVEGDPDEMTPRLKLHMSPYSAVTDTSDFAAYSDFSNFAIDSDFLDGMDASDFAEAVHDHDDEYVNENQPGSINSLMVLDGSLSFGDMGQNSAAEGQVMKWQSGNWVAADDETGSGGANGWSDDGTIVRLDGVNDSVGIGTLTPSEKLDVSGNIHASGTIISGNSITIDGTDDMITASSGTIDFDDENVVTTGKATFGDCENSGFSSFVAGSSNSVSGNYSTIGGGYADTIASSIYSTISGGRKNKTEDAYTTIAGGNENSALSNGATIGGGVYNTTLADYGGVFSGYSNFAGNTSDDTAAFIGGGYDNSATAEYTTVAGGASNVASGRYTTVGGGSENTANSDWGTISGGQQNTSGTFATVGGGGDNTASGGWSTIGGGGNNSATETSTTISGGAFNDASGRYSAIGGGTNNSNAGRYSVISGGYADTVTSTADYSYLFGIRSKLTEDSTFMVDMPHIRFGDETNGFEFPSADGSSGQVMATDGSGQLSWADVSGFGNWSVSDSVLYTNYYWGIARGDANNKLWRDSAHTHVNMGVACTTGASWINFSGCTVGGGQGNTAGNDYATIAGGVGNSAGGDFAVVSGGSGNTASAYGSTIGGGQGNIVIGDRSTIGGGWNNEARASMSTVGGGSHNKALYGSSTVGGGAYNNADSAYSTVAGGDHNEAIGRGATVGGGQSNNAVSIGWDPTVSGGYNNTASNSYATVGGGYSNTSSGVHAAVGGGASNIASEFASAIPGGFDCEANGRFSFAAGQRAKADHDGSFVWADTTASDFSSTNTNQFRIRATNGLYQRADNSSYAAYFSNIGSGDGIRAFADVSISNIWGAIYAVNYGTSPTIYASGYNNGYAGYFSGDVNVTGTLSKGGGSFKIDHPLDPENKYLYHSFVESPDMMNIYNGNVITDAAGEAEVILPDYFEVLNRDFRYQLTVIGTFAQAIIAEKIRDGRFTIKSDKPFVEVSWQVTGIRQDAFANANRIPVEEYKKPEGRGKYIHPEAHGFGKERGVGYEEHQEKIREMIEERQGR
jgi:hypothetical protein